MLDVIKEILDSLPRDATVDIAMVHENSPESEYLRAQELPVWLGLVPKGLIYHPDGPEIFIRLLRKAISCGASQGPYGGKLAVHFLGWDDDPRCLWEIPGVVRFCYLVLNKDPGVIFGMIDEDTPGYDMELLCGRMFFVSLAYADSCWPNSNRTSGRGGMDVSVVRHAVECCKRVIKARES